MKIIAVVLTLFASLSQAACPGWIAPFFVCPADSTETDPQECYCQCDPSFEKPEPLKERSSLLEKLDYYLLYPWIDPGTAFTSYSPHELFMAACSEFVAFNQDEDPYPFELLMRSMLMICDEDVGVFIWDYILSIHNHDELGQGMAIKILTELKEDHPGSRALAHRVEDAIKRGKLETQSWTLLEKSWVYQILGNLGDGTSVALLKRRLESLSLICVDGSTDDEERLIEKTIRCIQKQKIFYY